MSIPNSARSTRDGRREAQRSQNEGCSCVRGRRREGSGRESAGMCAKMFLDLKEWSAFAPSPYYIRLCTHSPAQHISHRKVAMKPSKPPTSVQGVQTLSSYTPSSAWLDFNLPFRPLPESGIDVYPIHTITESIREPEHRQGEKKQRT